MASWFFSKCEFDESLDGIVESETVKETKQSYG